MIEKIELYQSELDNILSNSGFPWSDLDNRTILITGSTGLIGSFLVDLLMRRNINYNSNITIIANGISLDHIKARFSNYLNNNNFYSLIQDVTIPFVYSDHIDYVIHAASNANPKMFTDDPVGTMNANFYGLNNLLQLAINNNIKRLLYVSSGEVYGIAGNDIEKYDESCSGYVDINNFRSCYPISKRASETLCASYIKQYDLDIVIARPCHIYGPTLMNNDSRVYAQFINNVLNNQDIVLKSKGLQKRSYCYVADCVFALLYILLLGERGEAYNIASEKSIVTIAQMAEIVAEIGGCNVKYEIDNNLTNNPMNLAILDSNKLESLGWKSMYDMHQGMKKTIDILKKRNTSV